MNSLPEFIFKYPAWLWLLLLIPVLYWLLTRQEKLRPKIIYSTAHMAARLPKSLRQRLLGLPKILRLLMVVCVIAALARPQSGKKNSEIRSEGIDILLCLDISGSMRLEDMNPTRLHAAKKVIGQFIQRRFNDRIGLVVYGSEAFLQCPLTLDHGVLSDFVDHIDFIPELENSTAIGMALSTGVYSLKKSKAKSKVIILLTDGENNAGDIDPLTASEIAATMGVKTYTIGLGQPGVSESFRTIDDPFFGKRKVPVKNKMDEELLKEIADITGGLYFNAKNETALTAVYKKIDKLEKTEIKTNQYLEYNELFIHFLGLALGLLGLELVLSSTYLRVIP